MSEKLNVAIVGHGFVGKAVDFGFGYLKCDKTIIDPRLGTKIEELQNKKIDITFICVPTPMNDDASIDARILIKATADALKFTDGLVVIKSTVIPAIIGILAGDSDRIIYNPEFLTEKNANEDFINPVMHVFGGKREYTDRLEEIYSEYSSCNDCAVHHMSATEASFVKYGMNSFLSAKVIFFNQFYDIIEKFGENNYDTIVNAIGTDKRIGNSHTAVPGPIDKLRGFGGSCFPKDSAAFIKFAQSIDKDFTVMEEVVRRNQEYRTTSGSLLDREKAQNIRFDFDI